MELIVKIKSDGTNPRYQDGDVVEAMSLDRIYLAHAEMICHPNNFGFNTNGTRDLNTLLQKFQADFYGKQIQAYISFLLFRIS